jgi:hypothetical protein
MPPRAGDVPVRWPGRRHRSLRARLVVLPARVRGPPSLIDLAAAYLAGAAIGAASPTPGGVGAIEAALVGALIGFNFPSGSAVAGVLAFRLVTYWLPILPGTTAFRALRRIGHCDQARALKLHGTAAGCG